MSASAEVQQVSQEVGLCECGCGRRTTMAIENDKRNNRIKGMPARFIRGHSSDGQRNGRWKGGRYKIRGYVMIYQPFHPFCNQKGYVAEHRLIAEKLLGRILSLRVQIHHPFEKSNNKVFVVCEDQAYHSILEQRTRAFKECGHADWIRCYRCKKYDAPDKINSYHYKNNGRDIRYSFHRECENEYQRKHNLKLMEGNHGISNESA